MVAAWQQGRVAHWICDFAKSLGWQMGAFVVVLAITGGMIHVRASASKRSHHPEVALASHYGGLRQCLSQPCQLRLALRGWQNQSGEGGKAVFKAIICHQETCWHLDLGQLPKHGVKAIQGLNNGWIFEFISGEVLGCTWKEKYNGGEYVCHVYL